MEFRTAATEASCRLGALEPSRQRHCGPLRAGLVYWASMKPSDDQGPPLPGLVLPAILAVVLVVHLPGLANGFVWDDGPLLAGIERADPGRLLTAPLLEGTRPGESAPALDYVRPLVSVSLALDLRLWGRNSPALHATNLGLHLLALSLVWLFLGRLGLSGRVRSAAVLLAGLHPLTCQPVYWISARGDLLATVFGLAALVLWSDARQARSRIPLAASLLALALAAAAKESAVWLVPGLVLVETMGPGLPAPGRRARLAALAVVVVLLVWLRIAVAEGGAGPRVPGAACPAAAVATVASTLTTYLRWLVVPVPLPQELAASALPLRGATMAALPSLAFAALVVAAALALLRASAVEPPRRLLPLLALATLIPVANAVVLSPPLAQRHAYPLTLLGVAALAAWLAPLLRGSRLGLPSVVLLSLLFAHLSWCAAPVWFSDVSLFTTMTAELPPGSFATAALARALLREGLPERAEAVLLPSLGRAADGRCVRLLARLLEDRGELLRAESLLRHDLTSTADVASAVALTEFLIRQRRFDGAETTLDALPALVTGHPAVAAARVALAAAAGDANVAVERARRFLADHGDDPRRRRIERLEAAALGALGRRGEARALLLRTWAASGGGLTDTRLMAELAASEGRLQDAVALLDDVTPALPSSPEELRTAMDLASLLARAGRLELALDHYQGAVAAGFDLAPVRAGQALLLLALGRPVAARTSLLRLVELRPADVRAREALRLVSLALRNRETAPVDAADLVARVKPLLPGPDEPHDEEAP